MKDGNKCYFVRVSDIFLIESVGNYSKFYFEDQKPLIHSSLSKVQERLDPTTFFRANRQFILNTEFITNIASHYKGGLTVTLRAGQEIEVSARNAVLFKDLMGM